MNDRIRTAQDEAVKAFIASVGRALSGMSGDVDEICDTFTEKHDRHTAQAVLQLYEYLEKLRQEASHLERVKMRKEAGFLG